MGTKIGLQCLIFKFAKKLHTSLECLYQLSIVEYYPNFKMPAYSSRWIFIVSGHDFDLARAIFKMRLSRGFSVEEFGLFGG